MRKQDMGNQFSKKTRKKAGSIQAQRIFRSRWFKSLVAMGSAVVFFTVYSLIIPAATLTEDQAAADSGIVLEEPAPSEPQVVETEEAPAPEPAPEEAPKEEPVAQAAVEETPAAASEETAAQTPVEETCTAPSAEQGTSESAAAGSGSEETKDDAPADTADLNQTASAVDTTETASDGIETEETDATLTEEETAEDATTESSEESAEETREAEEEIGTVSELKAASGNLEALVRFADGAGIPENASLVIYGAGADTGKVQDALWSGSMDSIERSSITTDLSEYVSFAVKDADGNDITPDSDCSIEISFGSEANLSDPGENRIRKYGSLVVDSDGNVSVTGTDLSTGNGHTYATFTGTLSGNTFGFAVTTADRKVNCLESLSGKTSDGAVEAALSFGKDAKVPEGSSLTVETASVNESSVLDKFWGDEEGVNRDTAKADDIRFVKFVIRDRNGNEVRPEIRVSVKLTFHHEADLSEAAEGFVKKHKALAAGSDGTITLGSGALSAGNGITTVSFSDVSAKSAFGYAVTTAEKKIVYATKLTGKSEDGSIEASLRLTEEAKIPEGSLLKVTPVTGESVQKTLLDNIWTDTSIIDPDTIKLTDSGLATVTITDKDGNVRKPEADAELTLTFNKEADLAEAARKMVKRAKAVEMTEENVKLSDSGLSVAEGKTRISYTGIVDGQTFGYAVSTAKQKTNFLEGKLSYEGEDYTIEVSVSKDNQIPENSKLNVKELDKDSEEFKKKLDQAAEAVQKDAEKKSSDDIETSVDDASVRMFDITILNEDGDEIQPNGNVRVSVQYKNAVKVGADAKMKAVHFDEKNDEVQVLTPETKADTSDTEKKVHEVKFDANGFSVYAIVGTSELTTKYITASGETYEVTVTYSPDVGVPDGAELLVTEITEEDKEYSSYAEQTASIIDSDVTALFFLKLLDISIVDQNGDKVILNAPVSVKIRLLDREEMEGAAETKVVHFGEETEVLENDTDGDTVSFDTEGFSVYAVVTIENLSELDGKTFGIINTVNGTKPSGVAMMSAIQNSVRLQGKTTTVRVDPVGRTDNVYVANNSNISMWTFNRISDSQYYITIPVNNNLKYLKISATGLALVDQNDLDDDCKITITEGTGSNAGKHKFSTENGVLQWNGGTQFVRAASNATNNIWMNFAELSALNDDDFVVYTAEKVSISGTETDGTINYDIKNGDQVVIYTRIWNEDTLRYDYYAIDYDGMLVKAYESGDTISWVGSKVNTMLWDFTEYYYEGTTTPNYYYELQNNYSKKYLTPQVSGTDFLSDNKIGLNLNGRRYNNYYSTILAWDDAYYDYASLMVQNYQLISAPMSRAWDFYFAKMTMEESGDITLVETIDHEPFGITLKMQDYGDVNNGRSTEMNSILGNTSYVQWFGSKNLVKRNMGNDDYPIAVYGEQKSLSNLYDNTLTVNQQFLLNTYKETGYFEYDSTQNFAHLITSSDDPWFGKTSPSGSTYKVGDFVIYDQLGTSGEVGKDTLRHGQFLPYNDLITGFDDDGNPITIKKSTQYQNTTDIHASPLSTLDPRYGEAMYEIKNGTHSLPDVDHFFGMELSARFMQSASGLDAWGHDLIFEFSGDDDFWLFVDGMLVLDLGGIHSALDGSINFRTGIITYQSSQYGYQTTTLREQYRLAYLENHSGASAGEVNAWLNTIFDDDGSNTGTVFKDYSGHTMRMFYMERGAGASNLHMRFNLAPYVDGEVQLEKEVTGTDTVDASFPFQIWVEKELPSGKQYVLFGQTEEEQNKVTDSKTGNAIPYEGTYTVDELDYNHVFFLKPGQTASIQLPSETTKYYFSECGIDPNTYDQVRANGVVLEGSSASDSSTLKNYQIVSDTVSGRKKVIYENHVSQNALQTLTITKRLWQNNNKTTEIRSGTGANADNTEFCFRIYIGKDDAGQYTVYNTGKYYIKDPDGYYCTYDSSQGGFVSTNKTNFSDLSTDVPDAYPWKSQQEQATFYTSPGGAADKIRAGYSIEIPGLMSGTAFKVEERSTENPSGYNLIDYTFTNGAFEKDSNEGISTNEGVVSSDNSNETLSVHNQHGYGLTVRKVWSDAAFMDSHEDIYFAVYLDDELIDGTVRCLKDPATSISWFFSDLTSGKTLNDYQVYEVTLTGSSISVDPDTGIVTDYDSIKKKIEDDSIDVEGKDSEQGYSSSYTYTVSYSRQELSAEQIGNNVNSRTDTVSNSRPGIKLVKTDSNGNYLSGAVFTLSGNDGKTKTFTSDENGLIAVAYLVMNEEYTLTEVSAPYGYMALMESLTVKVDADNKLYVNGLETAPENGYYTITQVASPTATSMPTVTIKDQDYTLQAVKVDSYTENPMAGVHFALYSEVFETVNGIPDPLYPMPDYTPMSGYEDLVTDSNGVIPKIVMKNSENSNGLTPGTYYLREKDTPSGYNSLGIDIRITISATGQITLQSAERPMQSGHWKIEQISSDIADAAFQNGKITITVQNTPKDPVRIRKLEQGTSAHYLKNVKFALYKVGQIEDGKPREGETPLISGSTDLSGLLSLGGLEENTSYYLFETETLDGYILLDSPVIITTVGANNIKASMNGAPLSCEKVKDSENRDVWEIVIYNSSGYELPSTGGSGTLPYTLGGLALILASALMYGFRMRRRERRLN